MKETMKSIINPNESCDATRCNRDVLLLFAEKARKRKQRESILFEKAEYNTGEHGSNKNDSLISENSVFKIENKDLISQWKSNSHQNNSIITLHKKKSSFNIDENSSNSEFSKFSQSETNYFQIQPELKNSYFRNRWNPLKKNSSIINLRSNHDDKNSAISSDHYLWDTSLHHSKHFYDNSNEKNFESESKNKKYYDSYLSESKKKAVSQINGNLFDTSAFQRKFNNNGFLSSYIDENNDLNYDNTDTNLSSHNLYFNHATPIISDNVDEKGLLDSSSKNVHSYKNFKVAKKGGLLELYQAARSRRGNICAFELKNFDDLRLEYRQLRMSQLSVNHMNKDLISPNFLEWLGSKYQKIKSGYRTIGNQVNTNENVLLGMKGIDVCIFIAFKCFRSPNSCIFIGKISCISEFPQSQNEIEYFNNSINSFDSYCSAMNFDSVEQIKILKDRSTMKKDLDYLSSLEHRKDLDPVVLPHKSVHLIQSRESCDKMREIDLNGGEINDKNQRRCSSGYFLLIGCKTMSMERQNQKSTSEIDPNNYQKDAVSHRKHQFHYIATANHIFGLQTT